MIIQINHLIPSSFVVTGLVLFIEIHSCVSNMFYECTTGHNNSVIYMLCGIKLFSSHNLKTTIIPWV